MSPRNFNSMDDLPVLQLRQPLRVPTQDATTTSMVDSRSSPAPGSPIHPSFVHHDPAIVDDGCQQSMPAPNSLQPMMMRSDFFSNPSLERMKSMTEAQLSQIDNLEVGRLGFGSITWPGVTDVRRIDFDVAVSIERGSVAIYPNGGRPSVGEGLNKDAVVRLNIKPSRAASVGPQDASLWQQRVKELTEAAGNTFISYDLEVWTFKTPHFEARG